MYIDSHAHLDGPKFDSDRDQVLVRAREAGLERILAIGSGTGPGTLDCAIKVASQHDWIYATIGIHPHEARLATEADYAEMQQLAANPKVVAWDDTLQMLRDHWASSGLPGILHCFTGEWKHAQAALDIGFYISFAGNVSFPKAENIREAAKQVPLERMLIETDSPFLAPVPHRGKRNEPAFVVNTAETIATLRGITPEETGEQTRNNFYRLFPVTSQASPVQATGSSEHR